METEGGRQAKKRGEWGTAGIKSRGGEGRLGGGERGCSSRQTAHKQRQCKREPACSMPYAREWSGDRERGPVGVARPSQSSERGRERAALASRNHERWWLPMASASCSAASASHDQSV